MIKLYNQIFTILLIASFLLFNESSFGQSDNCVGATVLVASSTSICGNSYNGTTAGATQSMPGCTGSADDDVWFQFVASSSSHIITVEGVTLYDPVVQLFSGNCQSLLSIACVDNTAAAAEVVSATNLIVGATYFVRVYSYNLNNNQGTFTICVTTADNPSPYCASNAFDSARFINNFSTTLGITNINNISGYSANGYANNTAQSVMALPNSTVNFAAAFTGGSFGFNIWVDWNKDNDFVDAGEKVFASGTYVYSASGSITIPNGTLSGNYRMRIRATWLSTNPDPCGTHNSGGETEDYTFTVQAVNCNTTPTAIGASSITTTAATINWTAPVPAPIGGYIYYYSTSSTPPPFNGAGLGNTAAGVSNVEINGLSPGTTYYFWVRSNCGGDNNIGFWSMPISFTTLLLTTNSTICAEQSGLLTATGACGGFTSSMVINGAWNTNPTAFRPLSMTNSGTCNFASNTSTYATFLFQVSVTGTYVFLMADRTNYDGLAYIVSENFIPGSCGSGIWVVGDDDSSPYGNEPQLSATLTAGVTYNLVSTVWSGNNITITDTFQYTITGPGAILTGSTGVIQWYANATGGSPIGTGSTFNPVGVTGSPLANTNAAGTTTFYAACSLAPDNRTPANFIIKPKPTATLSALGSLCNLDTKLSILFTGNPPWNIVYTDNVTNSLVNVAGITSSPYVIPVAPTQQTLYTLTNISNECSNGTIIGSAEFKANTWVGLTDVWASASNWSSGLEPTDVDCVIIPTSTIYPKITLTDASAKELLILNDGRLDILNDKTLTVSKKLTVQGSGQFNISNNSSLVQIDAVANEGKINLTRITQPMYRYDYTYWNSPVSFDSNFTLSNLSPDTLWDKYWLWQPTISNAAGNWLQIPASTIMNPIVSYLVRAPQYHSTDPTVKQTYTAIFKGIPNNGNITVLVSRGTLPAVIDDDKWNLIGNPYPSAIQATTFTGQNSSAIDGTLYFWTHNTQPMQDPTSGNNFYHYSSSDYATWNNTGGLAATSGGLVPNGLIATGTAFFLRCNVAGNVVFTNQMRVAGSNDQFFKPLNSTQEVISTTSDLEKHLIRVSMMNATNSFSQILVGYVQSATMGYDNGLDGIRFSSAAATLYSVIESHDLAIQARSLPFEVSDVVQLGIQSSINDEFLIAIDETDLLFENYSIYLVDKFLDISHDLKVSPYSFSTAAGKFDDRFELRYTENHLGLDGTQNSEILTAYIKNQTLFSRSINEISSVVIFDISGKQICSLKPEDNLLDNKWKFLYAQGVYFAKFALKNGSVVTRKIVN